MTGHGYFKSKHDSCVFLKRLSNKYFIYLLLYIDDMLIAFSDMAKINKLKALLKSKFEMKDLDATKKILKIEIKRDQKSGLLHLTQERYIEKIF